MKLELKDEEICILLNALIENIAFDNEAIEIRSFIIR